MGYSNFLFLKEELSLIAVMLILLVYDLFGSQKSLKYFHPVACVLFLAHTLLNLFPAGTAEAFGGMYVCTPIGSIVKTYLNTGTLIDPAPGLQLGKQRVGTDPPGRILPDSVLLLAGYVFHDFCGQFSVILHRSGDSLYTDGRVVCIRQIQTPVGRGRG